MPASRNLFKSLMTFSVLTSKMLSVISIIKRLGSREWSSIVLIIFSTKRIQRTGHLICLHQPYRSQAIRNPLLYILAYLFKHPSSNIHNITSFFGNGYEFHRRYHTPGWMIPSDKSLLRQLPCWSSNPLWAGSIP